MTLIEHLKSDSDVIKLIVLSIGAVGIGVYLVYLATKRLGFWRKKVQAKRRQLQRPFIASNKISPTPKDSSPTFRSFPLNNWSKRWSPSLSPSKTFTTPAIDPVKPKRQLTYLSSLIEKQSSPISQVASSLNKPDSKQSVGLCSPVKNPGLNLFTSRDHSIPLIFDTSTTDDSTLPSLMLSSEDSTESITEKINTSGGTSTKKITMDKSVNVAEFGDTDFDNNNQYISVKQSKIESRRPKQPIKVCKDNFTMHLWSHKCQLLPCVYEARPASSSTWSTSGHSDTHYDDVYKDSTDNLNRSTNRKSTNEISSASSYFVKDQNSSQKCASDAIPALTEFAGGMKADANQEQSDFKMSPLCSSDSTIKETENTIQCCFHSSSNKSRKQSKHQKKLKKSSLVRSLDRKLPEELEMLDNGASIMDKTSFIPPKSWYSLGSLCDGEDNCDTCQNWKYDAHRSYHMRMYDSDTKLNTSGDAISYNDTGYTSTEEDSSRNSTDMKVGGSPYDQQSSPENGSYDGDYESDEEIFQVRLVGSEDMVYKPLLSISEPFGIEAYAAREWNSDTPKAQTIRQGYAAIPSHVSCHQLRQIRGDNYCAIRATLFQSLLNAIPVLKNLPNEGIPQILRTILSSTKISLQEWSFANRILVEKSDVISTLEEILGFFIDEVHRCQEITSKEAKTEYLLSLFNEENKEFKLMEAVKLIMLYQAILLYYDMNQGRDVPVLAWLLFGRDTSPDPSGLLRHHLNSVGNTGGLEQVEMCLLGYALGVVIQVFRPSEVSKPDFIANYPYLEDMATFSPTVSLVAEDDRHYNIVVE